MHRFACSLGKPLPVECSELIRGKSSSHAHLEVSVTLWIAEELKVIHVQCGLLRKCTIWEATWVEWEIKY